MLQSEEGYSGEAHFLREQNSVLKLSGAVNAHLGFSSVDKHCAVCRLVLARVYCMHWSLAVQEPASCKDGLEYSRAFQGHP